AGKFGHGAEGGDGRAGRGDEHSFLDFGNVGDADGATGTHDHVQRFGEERAQAEFRDRLLVAAADVHRRGGTPEVAGETGERRGERAREVGIAKLQRNVVHDVTAIYSGNT